MHKICLSKKLQVIHNSNLPLSQPNEQVASNQILAFAQRLLGSPWGKHCKLLKGNVW